MAINTIIDAMVELYEDHFTRSSGDLRILRVTPHVPEAVTEWPWLFFVVGDGDVELMTFAADVAETPKRRQALAVFGSSGTTKRPKVQMVHRFKAQLLVKPRRDLSEDEALVRPFVQPVITLMAEHLEVASGVEYCKPTGYRYGVFPVGKLEERAVEFVGLEIDFEAREVV